MAGLEFKSQHLAASTSREDKERWRSLDQLQRLMSLANTLCVCILLAGLYAELPVRLERQRRGAKETQTDLLEERAVALTSSKLGKMLFRRVASRTPAATSLSLTMGKLAV